MAREYVTEHECDERRSDCHRQTSALWRWLIATLVLVIIPTAGYIITKMHANDSRIARLETMQTFQTRLLEEIKQDVKEIKRNGEGEKR